MQDIKRYRAGARVSQAVAFGNIAFLAGQVATETKGASVTEQTAEVLSRIDELLADAGTDKTRLLSASVWLADIAHFAEMNAVWDAWVQTDAPPARACVEARLANPAYAVEISVVAAL